MSTYYVTAWWQSRGVIKVDGLGVSEQSGTKYASGNVGHVHHFHRIGVDAFDVEDDAYRALVDKIDRKLKSVARTEKKLLAMLDRVESRNEAKEVSR